jgi:hypothetical protein
VDVGVGVGVGCSVGVALGLAQLVSLDGDGAAGGRASS